MRHRSRTTFLALTFLVTAPFTFTPRNVGKPGFAGPATMVWAWERPEDLRFLRGRPVGVAYLARTFYLQRGTYGERGRMQPLAVAPDAWMMAVARIEAAPGPVRLGEADRDALAADIAGLTQAERVRALQIDFDATASQRDFYLDLLQRVRAKLRRGTPLSMTALVSWCVEGDWLRAADVDEAVPMLFRMGTGARDAEAYLRTHDSFAGTPCAGSVGTATDERLALAPAAQRRYIFHPAPWTEQALPALAASR